MQIKTVEFSRLVSFGTFNNVRVGVTVELEGDESPHLALCRAQSWVHRELVKMVGESNTKDTPAQNNLPLGEEQF